MSETLQERILTSGKTEDFILLGDVSTETTETKETETQVFSLEIPENESLEEFDKDMDQLTKESIKDWDN